jgi:hypothetical protein
MCRPQIQNVTDIPDFVPVTSQAAAGKKQKKAKKAATTVEPAQDKVLAERFRTKKCRNWIDNGSCPYESRCMFAHGDHQLRTTEMNLRDGLTNEEAIRQFKRMLVLKARAQAAHANHLRMAEARVEQQDASAMHTPEQASAETSYDEFDQFQTPSSTTSTTTPSVYSHNPYGYKVIDEYSEVPTTLSQPINIFAGVYRRNVYYP